MRSPPASLIRTLPTPFPNAYCKCTISGFPKAASAAPKTASGSMSTGELLLRADPKRMDEALAISGAAPMKMGERMMTGFYTVDFDAIANDDDLKAWIDRSWAYVKTMPPKAEKPAAAKKSARKPR